KALRLEQPGTKWGRPESGWWTHTAFAGTCPLTLEFGTPCNGSRPSLSFLRHQGIYCVLPASRRRTALAVPAINTCTVPLYGQTKAPAVEMRQCQLSARCGLSNTKPLRPAKGKVH